ncbi:GNAT family N-acetyltransferase [Serratia oryzae]|uniref:GNAT family N-acetyltransferase n=1 Tax=Serratia oryzae TaxID=2034155 RepID=UPI0012E11FF7|nr:GNAT family N-acetyltransferase [Serratia oryzae]
MKTEKKHAIPVLKTHRLILQPLELSDSADIQRLFPHWEIVKYITHQVPWPYPEGAARQFIQEVALPNMAKGSGWYWSIRLKADARHLIGVINLCDPPNANRGFWLTPEWQHHGLMSEASAAVTDFWFNQLGKPVLRVPKAKGNLASRRISERSGMRVIATQWADFVGGHMESEIWEITKDEWNRNK